MPLLGNFLALVKIYPDHREALPHEGRVEGEVIELQIPQEIPLCLHRLVGDCGTRALWVVGVFMTLQSKGSS